MPTTGPVDAISSIAPSARTIIGGQCPALATMSVPSSWRFPMTTRSEEHTSELQSPCNLVCRLLLEKKKHEFQAIGGFGARSSVSSPNPVYLVRARVCRRVFEILSGSGGLRNVAVLISTRDEQSTGA